MPGVDIGAILSAIGGMLLQALMNALTNTLTQLITGAITNALEGVADALEGFLGADSWLADALRTFTSNLAAELTGAVSDLLNTTNQIAQTAWGIIDSQQRLHEQLAGIVDQSVGALAHSLNLEQEREYRTGAALTELLLQFVAGRERDMREFADMVLSAEELAIGAPILSLTDSIERFWAYIERYMLIDLEAVEALPREELEYVSGWLNEWIRENHRRILEWFHDSVVVPISTANAFRSAFSEGLMLEPEEYAEVILAHQEAMDRAMAKYAEKLEERVVHGGEVR